MAGNPKKCIKYNDSEVYHPRFSNAWSSSREHVVMYNTIEEAYKYFWKYNVEYKIDTL